MSIPSLSPLQHTAPGPEVGMQQGLAREPSQADIDLFHAAAGEDSPRTAAFLPGGMAGSLATTLGGSEKLSQRALREMKHVAGSDDGAGIIDMSRALSQCSLQMALTTKVVSKSAQALDKLTNLQ